MSPGIPNKIEAMRIIIDSLYRSFLDKINIFIKFNKFAANLNTKSYFPDLEAIT
tara:strand:- start:1328 stop:1489 length:162 start_codon:yes stop_codon:yes gene_type:complete